AAGQRGWRVVLADVDAVGLHLEGQVGAVIEDERDVAVATHTSREARPLEQQPGVEVLLAQLDHVDPAGDAPLEERGQVGTVRGAEVQASPGECVARHPPATARTSSTRSPSASTVVALSPRSTG